MSKTLTFWLTGLSGSGKSTLSLALYNRFAKFSYTSFQLDGDVVRTGLCSDLGFSDNDRHENVRRIAEVAKLLNQAGVTVLASFISPFKTDRALARKIIGPDKFVEIYIKASLETCEKRDPKGLYKKARAGKIKKFTGVDSPYEVPAKPDLVVPTSEESVQQSVDRVVAFLKKKKKVTLS
ncbi:MAG: adenylyl-sulfate kinase [Elusimicrobia bacterium RIFOXYB2_FULL_49_7]|nr:MAG: adenylyl-sulfate kinase [Elusimicrobia bacterium RIFOXYB2_FULL_49_7]